MNKEKLSFTNLLSCLTKEGSIPLDTIFYWKIFIEDDINHILKNNEKLKTIFLNELKKLVVNKIPTYIPFNLTQTYTKKHNNSLDKLPMDHRPLTRDRTWQPEVIYDKEVQNMWHRDEHFKVVPVSTEVNLRNKSKMENIQNIVLKPKGDISHSSDSFFKEIPSLSHQNLGKHKTDWAIEWICNPPKQDTKLFIDYEFCPPVDLGEIKKFKTVSPHKLSDTSLLSPLSKLLLTNKEIFQKKEEWQTLIKFNVAERVEEFIQITENTKQAAFIQALSPRNHEYRISLDSIPLKHVEDTNLYFPYHKDSYNFLRENIKDIWFLIQLEQFYHLRKSTKTLKAETQLIVRLLHEEIQNNKLISDNTKLMISRMNRQGQPLNKNTLKKLAISEEYTSIVNEVVGKLITDNYLDTDHLSEEELEALNPKLKARVSNILYRHVK